MQQEASNNKKWAVEVYTSKDSLLSTGVFPQKWTDVDLLSLIEPTKGEKSNMRSPTQDTPEWRDGTDCTVVKPGSSFDHHQPPTMVSLTTVCVVSAFAPTLN